MTNYKLIQLLNSLQQFENKKLPQQISYAISKNFKILKKEYDLYEEQLKKIFSAYESYFEKDAGGQIILQNGIPKVENDQAPAFYSQINELLNMKINIDDMYYISEDLFNYEENNGRYDCLSSNQILLLQSIICNNK